MTTPPTAGERLRPLDVFLKSVSVFALGAVLITPRVTTAQEARGTSRASDPINVVVHGSSVSDRLKNSVEAVKVIDTDKIRRESADMAEVLARTQGVGVRRAGGIGSDTNISLNGLTGDRVRFFVDGIPLKLAGYAGGIANLPVNLAQRIEIFSGVVPIRFGADALGGAINVVSDYETLGTHAKASYEVGSFATHQFTASSQHLFEPEGFVLRLNGFANGALNNYPIVVNATDQRGRLYETTVRRFHDNYKAAGLTGEVGLVNQLWAQKLILRAFGTGYEKEFQHNFSMTVPYGGVTYSEEKFGANLSYAQYLGADVFLDAVLGYSRTRGHFLDVDPCIYDWFGSCISQGRIDGETDRVPHDSIVLDEGAFGRLNIEWLPDFAHSLRLSLAPSVLRRRGEERRLLRKDVRDPLSARRDLLTWVSGTEYQTDFFNSDLENILFAKHFWQVLRSEDPRSNNGDVGSDIPFRPEESSDHRVGWGNRLRYRFSSWLQGKLSYELATRLPSSDEIFGDNIFILANLELKPETSHNLNLELTVDTCYNTIGAIRASVTAFGRDTNRLISLLRSGDKFQTYHNVYGARSLGVEAKLSWVSSSKRVALEANVTEQSFRNTSSRGSFGNFKGDRIPNQPHRFFNGSAQLRAVQVLVPSDEVSATWYSRYVHTFFRSWESAGIREFKQFVPSQLIHTLALTYSVKGHPLTSSSSVEVQNLTDEVAYDFFGAQRPGRAIYLKISVAY